MMHGPSVIAKSVSAIGSVEHLAHINDTIIKEYEEQTEDCALAIGDPKQIFGASSQ